MIHVFSMDQVTCRDMWEDFNGYLQDAKEKS